MSQTVQTIEVCMHTKTLLMESNYFGHEQLVSRLVHCTMYSTHQH